MPSFKSIPPELHSYIFQLGCTDDGSTIRILSLLSRYFHAIARPLLYHTLSISVSSSNDHLALLLKKLQSTPPHLRRISHLFLSDVSSSPSSSSTLQKLSEPSLSNLFDLLTLASPSLRTLSFIAHAPHSSTQVIARLFRMSFPLLGELSLSGYYPFPSPPPFNDDAHNPPNTISRMPSLKKLHLHGNRNPHGLLQSRSLEGACPALEELRVSGLAMASSFVIELEDALSSLLLSSTSSKKEGSDDALLFPASLPPNIKSVIVQAGVRPPLVGAKLVQLKHDAMMRQLDRIREIARDAEREGVRVVVLDRPEDVISPAEMKKVWLDGVGGGRDGWWS